MSVITRACFSGIHRVDSFKQKGSQLGSKQLIENLKLRFFK